MKTNREELLSFVELWEYLNLLTCFLMKKYIYICFGKKYQNKLRLIENAIKLCRFFLCIMRELLENITSKFNHRLMFALFMFHGKLMFKKIQI